MNIIYIILLCAVFLCIGGIIIYLAFEDTIREKISRRDELKQQKKIYSEAIQHLDYLYSEIEWKTDVLREDEELDQIVANYPFLEQDVNTYKNYRNEHFTNGVIKLRDDYNSKHSGGTK